jgi:signal transduction histidine kinase
MISELTLMRWWRLKQRRPLGKAGRTGRRIMSGDWMPAILAVICGSVIALGGFAITRHYYHNMAEGTFAAEAGRNADAVQEGITRYTDAMNAIATFVTASDRIDRWEFLRFANLTLDRYPGFSAFAWVPRVSHSERGAFESSVQRDGLFGLTIQETNSDDMLVKASKRLEYLPVAYLVPFEANEDALSYDLASEPRYRQVLDVAGDFGKLHATGPLALPRASETGPTLWLILPLYARNSTTSDILPRRKALVGFAIGVLRFDAFMKDVAGNFDSTGLDLSISDVSETNRYTLFELSQTLGNQRIVGEATQGATIEREFDVAGRRWLLVATQNSSKLFESADLLPWCVALFALLLTGLLVQHLTTSVIQRRTIERVVRRRTAELSDRNERLRSEILQRQRTEADLRTAKEQADAANQAKSQFLAMISHELRTPLNAIIGFSAVLSGEANVKLSPQNAREYAADIHHSGTHLLDLINDILDLSKAEVGKVELSDNVIDLRSVISNVVGMIRPRADEAAIKLNIELPSDLPVLHADERKLKQILLNLLSNAVKFTPDGGTVSIAVTEEASSDLIITVSDTGIGIAPDQIERVFEPFVQLDSSLARKYEGTGLGLSLSRRWVQLHGGSLVLESEPGAGTVARLRFPSERVQPSKKGGRDSTEATSDPLAKRPRLLRVVR